MQDFTGPVSAEFPCAAECGRAARRTGDRVWRAARRYQGQRLDKVLAAAAVKQHRTHGCGLGGGLDAAPDSRRNLSLLVENRQSGPLVWQPAVNGSSPRVVSVFSRTTRCGAPLSGPTPNRAELGQLSCFFMQKLRPFSVCIRFDFTKIQRPPCFQGQSIRCR